MIMEIGTDPLTYISGEAIAANIFGKTGKAAKIGIKGASGELDTVLKQGDNVVNGMLDAEKAAKGGSTADNIIEGGSKTISTEGDLAQEQIDALVKYSGNDYVNINNSLRGFEMATPENQATINAMQSALDISSISQYSNEAEILFNAGQEMSILSAESKNGILYITVLAE